MVKAKKKMGNKKVVNTKKGIKVGKKKGGGGVKVIKGGDARMKIISSNRSKTVDARDKLVKMAKTMDARQKLEKIRNLRDGKLEVKKTAKGGITITTTTAGKVLLTTKKNEKSPKKKGANAAAGGASKNNAGATKKIGNLTQTSKNGRLSIRTKKSGAGAVTKSKNKNSPGGSRGASTSGVARAIERAAAEVLKRSSSAGRNSRGNKKLTRTIRGEMSDSAKLDYELMTTRVDPVVLKRTVRQSVQRRERSLSPLEYYRSSRQRSPIDDYYDRRRPRSPRRSLIRRSRSRSPIYDSYYSSSHRSSRLAPAPLPPPPPRMHYDYDDPRIIEQEEEILRRRRQLKQQEENRLYSGRLSDDHYMASTSSGPIASSSASFSSPLSGTKVVVSNLQDGVTQKDIVELFEDVGPLRRAKFATPGTAEVVFINYSDAEKAVEIYHNRCLDGKAMRCTIK